MPKLILLAAALLLSPLTASAAPVPAPVRVTHVTWHGWKEAVEISNGIVEAIIVPQIGRVMAFERAGQPQTNPLYENPDLQSSAPPEAQKPGEWANYGGDKVWPAPQSEWPRFLGHDFPPDPAFDGRPEQAFVIPGGVRLVSPSSAAFGLRAERTLTLRPGEPRLYLTQSLVRLTPGAAPGLPLSVWAITQVQGDGLFVVPLPAEDPAAKFPPGYHYLLTAPPAPPFQRVAVVQGKRLLLARRDPVSSYKVATGARAGWVARIFGGLMFIERQKIELSGVYPDDDSPGELYSSAGASRYVEMEMLGPLTFQRPVSRLVWQLTVLPSPPVGDTEAASLAARAAARL